jgi:SHS2 domain-containing protein
MASHRFFDHTGDFGADIEASSREEIFAELAPALVHLLTDKTQAVLSTEDREIEVEGIDDEALLVALGNELLYLFEVEGFLAASLSDVDIEDGVLSALVHGERFDPARHPIARPIKAVTHHGAEVVEADGAWKARVIFDL